MPFSLSSPSSPRVSAFSPVTVQDKAQAAPSAPAALNDRTASFLAPAAPAGNPGASTTWKEYVEGIANTFKTIFTRALDWVCYGFHCITCHRFAPAPSVASVVVGSGDNINTFSPSEPGQRGAMAPSEHFAHSGSEFKSLGRGEGGNAYAPGTAAQHGDELRVGMGHAQDRVRGFSDEGSGDDVHPEGSFNIDPEGSGRWGDGEGMGHEEVRQEAVRPGSASSFTNMRAPGKKAQVREVPRKEESSGDDFDVRGGAPAAVTFSADPFPWAPRAKMSPPPQQPGAPWAGVAPPREPQPYRTVGGVATDHIAGVDPDDAAREEIVGELMGWAEVVLRAKEQTEYYKLFLEGKTTEDLTELRDKTDAFYTWNVQHERPKVLRELVSSDEPSNAPALAKRVVEWYVYQEGRDLGSLIRARDEAVSARKSMIDAIIAKDPVVTREALNQLSFSELFREHSNRGCASLLG